MVALAAYHKVLRFLVVALAVVAGCSVFAMMAVTCLDVILRAVAEPLTGTLDLVKVFGAIGIAGALPYTTAVKGHVAIEYFFMKLPPLAQIIVDTLVRLVGMALFGLFAWQSKEYGVRLYQTNSVTATLQMPVFWVPWVIAFSCGVVVLVILYNLTHPGKTMLRP